MSEYVTPSQHIEQTAFHSRAIEGVTTSTLGMVGLTEYGPVPHLATKVGLRPGPVLVESFSEYLQVFGGVAISGRPCLLALAARAFFDNGGRRLFVSRVFEFSKAVDSSPGIDLQEGFGSLVILAQGEPLIAWKARWPGSVASRIRVAVSLRRRGNALVGGELQGVLPGAVVEVADPPTAEIPDDINPVTANVRVVARCADGRLGYRAVTGGADPVDPAEVAFPLTFEATVSLDDRVDVYSDLELGREHPRCIFDVLQAKDPDVANALVWLDMVDGGAGSDLVVGELLDAVLSLRDGGWLTGGGDGGALSPELLIGDGLDNDNEARAARGLGALAGIDEIALVAIPDIVTLSEVDQGTAVNALIQHCEADGYRMAIVDPPRASSISEVRRFRAQFDTKNAALYYPWLRVVDPNGAPRARGALDCSMSRPPAQSPGSMPAATPSAGCTRHQKVGDPRNRRPHLQGHVHWAAVAERGWDQLPPVVRGSLQPGVGCQHHEFGPGVDLRRRPTSAHLP